ncbi:DNA mismatch repair protein [Borealophlyctis nickersoniae]|nr:DNA mismatch repair protein [Borealophlyctis nickersoniae]
MLEPSAPTSAPGRIRKLDQAVVNRIAAGEIIHRPANALKEMLENSIDAGSTSIQVLVKDGGLKLLQIQDNGHGIEKDDLGLVCERFATSKLKKYEDLEQIGTYGFRGEALASISHVAHVTITTKTEAAPCAWRSVYSDGKLVPAKPGASADPKPCAGNKGTQITVEDLFYNVATRRKALKNATEEYNRILDVVQRYAIHNSSVSFTCKKQGSNTADVHTLPGASTLDNIRCVYGASIAKEILSVEHESARWEFKMDGCISNANYSTKKMIFLLFINHRSVESGNLKRAIEALYAAYLPKGSHPFVYLSLEIKPQNVDVNVHPTKREVHFLNEDKIVETVCEAFQDSLANANQSRTFYTQTILPGAAPVPVEEVVPSKKSGQAKAPEHKMVRTDSRARTLDAFIVSSGAPSPRTESSKSVGGGVSSEVPSKRGRVEDETERDRGEEDDGFVRDQGIPSRKGKEVAKRVRLDGEDPVESEPSGPVEINEESRDDNDSVIHAPSSASKRQFVDVRLASVLELREEVRHAGHKGLSSLFNSHTFVGLVDEFLGLVQYQTKLYLINYQDASTELFYQLILKGFSNFGSIHLSQPAPIYDLVMIALDMEDMESWGENMMSKEEIAEDTPRRLGSHETQQCVALLVDRSEMLVEYFCFNISEAGEVLSLPLVLKGYLPNWNKLPLFLLKIASEVDWDEEKRCFETFSRELAAFYAVEPPVEPEVDRSAADVPTESAADPGSTSTDAASPLSKEAAEYRWMIEHVLFPAFQKHLVAPQSMAENGTVLQLANLPDLYRVFERC